MKIRKTLHLVNLCVFTIIFINQLAWTKDYYVDNNSIYNGNGATQMHASRPGGQGPFNSLMNALKVLIGDQSGNRLLLRRDQIFREFCNISCEGSENKPFAIDAYGSGNLPIINGADLLDKASDWRAETGEKFWYTSVKADPNQIFINGSRAVKVSNKSELDKENEWYFDGDYNRLYVFSFVNPVINKIEISSRDYGIYIKSRKYIEIRNIQIEKTKRDGFRIEGDSHFISFKKIISKQNYYTGMDMNAPGYKSTGGVIQNATFTFNGGSGIKLSHAANWIVSENNTSNNCLLNTGDESHNWPAGIKMTGTNTAENIIENNICSGNINGCGIWLDFCGWGNVVRYNLTCKNGSAGIFNEITSGTEIYYNISCNNQGLSTAAGIYIEGRGGPAPAGGRSKNITVYNNLLFGNDKFGLILQNGDGAQGNCSNNQIKNNISVNTINGPNLRVGGSAENELNIFQNNCLGPESEKFIEWGWSSFKSSYDSWEGAVGLSTRSLEADPQFTDPFNSNFQLKKSSPCIDAGSDVDLIRDFRGSEIPAGKRPDVGAFEYSTY